MNARGFRLASPAFVTANRATLRLGARARRRWSRISQRLRRRYARAIRPVGAHPRNPDCSPRVEVFIASLDTCAATELTLRSLRAFDQSDYDIVVGDGGSTDGSVDMLRRFEHEGWVRTELRTDRWRHHEWIEWRIATSEADYLVFCDSDMEFRKPHPIADLVATARRTGAALVAAEFCSSGPGVEPFSGSAIVMAERPSAWLFLVEPAQVRDVSSSFSFALVPNGAVVEGGIAHDTGALWFGELRQRGLPWAVMPGSFTRGFRHHAGLSWRSGVGSGEDPRAGRIRAHIERRLRTLRDQQRAS